MKNVFPLLLLVSFGVFAQQDSLQFPEKYFGIYKGDLKITNPNGTQTIPMEFHLKEGDSTGIYAYTLVYGEGEQRQERPYNLLTINKDKGDYVVDENNGILLDSKWVEDTLYCSFEVNGNLLTTTERFYEDSMDFEITFSSKRDQKVMGTAGENTIEVISYPITVVQKAHLLKQ